MKHLRLLPALCLLATSLWCEPLKAADLRVHITGLRSSEGTVHVAIFDKPEAFPKKDRLLADVVVPVDGNNVHAIFPNLSPGTYAAATYHDENANGSFDRGLFGIPLEGYAFSNGATSFLAPPDFADAAISVALQGTEIVIRMGY